MQLAKIKSENGMGTVYHDAKEIRDTVFILEQHVPETREHDQQDAMRRHYVGYELDHAGILKPVTTARINENETTWQVERVATLSAARGKGYAKQLMLQILSDAKANEIKHVALHAQMPAKAFYQKLGFEPVGVSFMDAGIEHIAMTLTV